MVTLRKDDFNNSGHLDMWGALVEQAILQGLLPKNTKSEDVDTISVEVQAAELN